MQALLTQSRAGQAGLEVVSKKVVPSKKPAKEGYRAPESFKPFREETEAHQIQDILAMSPETVFNAIKDKDMLEKPRWTTKSKGQLNASKYYSYHEYISHNTNECRDLLR